MVTEPLRAGVLVGATLLATAALAGCSGNPSTPAGSGSASATGSAGSTSASTSAAASSSASASSRSSAGSGSIASGSAATSIPAASWIRPSAIPLYAKYRWPSPASVAKSAKAPALSAVQDCQSTLSSADQAELGAFPAAQAELSPTSGGSGGRDDWAAEETVLATNDTSSGDIQGIYNLYTDLVADLGKCASTASGAKVSVAVNQGPEYAATITVPTSTGSTLTWHEYLAAPYGYLIELAVYVAPYSGDQPGAAWDGSSASTVLGALQSGPCSVTRLC
ncbi:hypothetical protein [Actinospica sp.]|uniref:hypothetical protein n=1 Tax=Actinospica sp. TaxID=1872142 RepID=UPI002BF992CB|nr:hypothetical protein [Actinospica sp.]HWG25351.1 hypothetical protein [Actinospica sp.]